MADYDDAERHALQEVEPREQLQWLLEEVDEDLTFSGWLQTQVAPPPGVPQRRGRTVLCAENGGALRKSLCLLWLQNRIATEKQFCNHNDYKGLRRASPFSLRNIAIRPFSPSYFGTPGSRIAVRANRVETCAADGPTAEVVCQYRQSH